MAKPKKLVAESRAQLRAQLVQVLRLIAAIDEQSHEQLVSMRAQVDRHLQSLFPSATSFQQRIENTVTIAESTDDRSVQSLRSQVIDTILNLWQQTSSSPPSSTSSSSSKNTIVRPHFDDLLQTIRAVLLELKQPVTVVIN